MSSDLPISFMAFMQMTSRRILISSLTELEDKLRTKKPSNELTIFEQTIGLSRRDSLRFFTNGDLKKPGMASKNCSSILSLPRAPIVQSKMSRSISDDRVEVF